MDSQNIHSIILQLKSIAESIDKVAKGVNNSWTVWIPPIVIAVGTLAMALATFMALKEDRNKLKEEKKGANKIIIEKIKMYLTTALKIEGQMNVITNGGEEINEVYSKLSAANKSLKEIGKPLAGFSTEEINFNNICKEISQINGNIKLNVKLISGHFEREDEYAIFISKPQVFSANVIRKIVTLFGYIPQFMNNFENYIEQYELNKAKIELFWMKLFCIETIMTLITEENLQKEIYYYNVYEDKNYTYSDLFNCCSKFIINMKEDEFIVQNNEAISNLAGRIQNIIEEFKIDISKPIEDIEICKMFK